MGAAEDVLEQILRRGLPKSEADADQLIDQLRGKKEEEPEQPSTSTSTRSRGS